MWLEITNLIILGENDSTGELEEMTRWVVDGVEPPPSQHPRFADSNLVAPADIRFPALPAQQAAEELRRNCSEFER